MAVGALGVDNIAEKSLLCHVQRVELEEVVAAVFEHDAVQAYLFGEVNKFPNLVHVHGRRHFYGRVLTMCHGFFGHGEVVSPVGSDVHEVDVGAFAYFLIAVFAVIDVGGRHAGLL